MSDEDWRSFILNIIAGLIVVMLLALIGKALGALRNDTHSAPVAAAAAAPPAAVEPPVWTGDTVRVRSEEGTEVLVTFWILSSSYRWKRGSTTEVQLSGNGPVFDITPSLRTLIHGELGNADAIVAVGTASQEFEQRDAPAKELEARESWRAGERANTLLAWMDTLNTAQSRLHYELVLGRWIGPPENKPTADQTAYQRRVIVLGLHANRLSEIPIKELQAALRQALTTAASTESLKFDNYTQFLLSRRN